MCWLVWVGVCVCAFLCVGFNVPPEVRVDCCALCVCVRVHVCARQRVLFDRRFRFDQVFGRSSRARAPTIWPRSWCANFRFHAALTCESAVRSRALRQFWQGSRSCRCTKSSHTKAGAPSLAFSKTQLLRSQNRVRHRADAGRA